MKPFSTHEAIFDDAEVTALAAKMGVTRDPEGLALLRNSPAIGAQLLSGILKNAGPDTDARFKLKPEYRDVDNLRALCETNPAMLDYIAVFFKPCCIRPCFNSVRKLGTYTILESDYVYSAFRTLTSIYLQSVLV